MLKKQILLLLSLFISTLLLAQHSYFKELNIQQLVRDDAGVLSSQQEKQLTQKLNQFSNQSSTQILVYTTNDLQGYDIADFAQRLGEATQVGQKGKDNGVVIVFKPKTNDSPGRVTLQTGYGIEALIPDATANQIIDNEMIPAFKQGNIYEGINNAIDVAISITKGEFTADTYQQKQQQEQGSSGGAIIVLIIFFVTFFSIFGRSRRSRYSNYGTRSNLPLWTALFLMGSGSRGSGWSDFSSGSGGFGGGGSGFGGFGGGSFGGGGASGSW